MSLDIAKSIFKKSSIGTFFKIQHSLSDFLLLLVLMAKIAGEIKGTSDKGAVSTILRQQKNSTEEATMPPPLVAYFIYYFISGCSFPRVGHARLAMLIPYRVDTYMKLAPGLWIF